MFVLSAFVAACSADQRDASHRRAVSAAQETISAQSGGTVGTPGNAQLFFPANAITTDTLITIRQGAAIPMPQGFASVGPCVEAGPDGLTFDRSVTIAVPVDATLVPDGNTLEDLILFRQESNGDIAPVPILGYDDVDRLIFGAIDGFTSFEAAVPTGQFAIVPQNSILATENTGISVSLDTVGEDDPVTFALVSSSKVDGVTDTDAVLAAGEIAPGITISTAGIISGMPTERGTWAFSVTATDATPLTSTISMTLTVAAASTAVIPNNLAVDGLAYALDDDGDIFAVAQAGSSYSLVKIPANAQQPSLSTTIGGGLISPAISVNPDGSGVVVVFGQVINSDPLNQQIWAVEYNGALGVVQAAFRVDQDPVPGATPDPTLTTYARQALRPGVAFAEDRNQPPPTPPPQGQQPPPPPPVLYCVVYEQIRNTSDDGSLRADIYAVWRQFGAAAPISAETRLDTTDDSGATSGDSVVVVGKTSGCLVLWTERGGDNAGTNGDDANGDPILGSPGEAMALVLSKPSVDANTVLPVTITAGTPAALNDEADTTGSHGCACVSPDNRFFAAWSERDDTPTPAPASSPATARASQTSAILFRRDLTLRAAEVTSGSASSSFLVDDAPVQSSVYSPSIAVDSLGDIAVAWVAGFNDGTQATYLRRFATGGTPIENSIEIGIGSQPLLAYDESDRLLIGFREGGDLNRLTLDPP